MDPTKAQLKEMQYPPRCDCAYSTSDCWTEHHPDCNWLRWTRLHPEAKLVPRNILMDEG